MWEIHISTVTQTGQTSNSILLYVGYMPIIVSDYWHLLAIHGINEFLCRPRSAIFSYDTVI